MNKINFDIEQMKSRDISGFGGGYEKTCQKMLKNGLHFLKDKDGFNWDGYKQFKNIYGVCAAEGKDSKALDKAMMKGIEDCTGAMHQVVVNHLAYIYLHGLQKWLEN